MKKPNINYLLSALIIIFPLSACNSGNNKTQLGAEAPVKVSPKNGSSLLDSSLLGDKATSDNSMPELNSTSCLKYDNFLYRFEQVKTTRLFLNSVESLIP